MSIHADTADSTEMLRAQSAWAPCKQITTKRHAALRQGTVEARNMLPARSEATFQSKQEKTGRSLCLWGSGLSARRANVDSLNHDRGHRRLCRGHPLWGAYSGVAARLR